MTVESSVRAACTILLVVAIGCSDAATRAGTVSDSAGVAIVRNPEVGRWSPSETWTVVEDLRIGTVEGDSEYIFGRVGSVDVDSRGRIHVLDAQAQLVRVYSAEGHYEATVGSPGSGPGEIGPEPASLFVGPGDTLLLVDLGNQRMNRYAPDGTSLGGFRLAFENGVPIAVRVARSGVIAVQTRPLGAPGQPSVDSLDAIVTLGPDGTVLDTLKTFPSGRTLRLSGDAPEITVFAGEPMWRLTDAGGVCFGVSDAYRMELYSPDGALERIVNRAFTRRPIAEADQEMMLSFFADQLAGSLPPEMVSQAVAQVRAIVRFAEWYPAFSNLLIGPGGSIWVQHVPRPSELTDEERISWNFIEVITGVSWNLIEDVGAREWDVFDPDGQFLGVVTMPPRFQPRTIVGDAIYGVWRDELEVPYAVRLRIEGVTD
jgi:hypothetical protein